MDFLEELRQRPEEERLAFAAVSAGIVVLVLLLAWGMFFFRSDNLARVTQPPTQKASAIEGLGEAQGDLETLVSDFSVQYQQLESALNELESIQEQQGRSAVELKVNAQGDVEVHNVIVPRNTFEEAGVSE